MWKTLFIRNPGLHQGLLAEFLATLAASAIFQTHLPPSTMDGIRANLQGEVDAILGSFLDRAAAIDALSKSSCGEAESSSHVLGQRGDFCDSQPGSPSEG